MFQELIDNITNVGVFTESLGEWASTLSINKVIIFIMMIFMIVGAIDKIRGNKLGYGEQFDEGFNAMGPLAAAMAGVVAAAPVLAIILKPIIVPKLIDQREAADMLGISHSNVKKLEAEGAFPFQRKMVGSAVRYRNTDIIDYIVSSEDGKGNISCCSS